MKLALCGAIGLTTAAVAMLASSEDARSQGAPVILTEPGGRPVRSDRPVGVELSLESPVVGRRPLGQGSLATRGQSSLERVMVGGHVRTPGPVVFAEGDTLRQAIARAGGATEFGSLKRVRLIRDGKLRSFDLTDDSLDPVPLIMNDTIEVPQKMLFGR